MLAKPSAPRATLAAFGRPFFRWFTFSKVNAAPAVGSAGDAPTVPRPPSLGHNQGPVHRPSATVPRPPATVPRPPATVPRPPATGHRPPATGHRPPATGHRIRRERAQGPRDIGSSRQIFFPNCPHFLNGPRRSRAEAWAMFFTNNNQIFHINWEWPIFAYSFHVKHSQGPRWQ